MEPAAFLALPAGVVIAAVATSVGIGGGILWMPLLLLFWGLSPERAVLTSLLIQCAGMGSGTLAYARSRLIDVRLGLFVMAACLPGLAAGAWLARHIRAGGMELLLGVFVLLTAFGFVSSNQRYEDTGASRLAPRRMLPWAPLMSLGAVASGLLSTAVGEWLVPLFRARLGLSMAVAIATCLFVTLANCVAASAVHWAFGTRPEAALVLWAVPGVVLGGQIGPWATRRIDERRLKEVFIFVLTLAGIHLIYNAYPLVP